jgi:hypothetical protein
VPVVDREAVMSELVDGSRAHHRLRRALATLVVALMTVVGSIAVAPPAQAAEGDVMSGTVRDPITNDPVPNVRVYLCSHATACQANDVTDASG